MVWINRTIPSAITTFDTASAARAAFSNRPFYLKHTIVNDVVTESYVEFVVTTEMASTNTGMTAGTYTLRGDNLYYYDATQDDWLCKPENIDSSTGECRTSAYYEANKAVLLSAFGSGYCTGYSSFFHCSVSGLSAGADSYGNVSANGGSANCHVNSDGSSICGV